MLLEKLFQVVEEISGFLILVNKIILVFSGSGIMGVVKVIGEVLDILICLLESVERFIGVSIFQVRFQVGVEEQNCQVFVLYNVVGVVFYQYLGLGVIDVY